MQRELADLKDEVTALRQITVDGGAGAAALALAPPRPRQQVWPHPSALLGILCFTGVCVMRTVI